MWRPAVQNEDELIVEMCLAFYLEDPGQPVTAEQTRRTLTKLRAEPTRGRALVAEREGTVAGYALLISFWSNEYGGEIGVIDELYVKPAYRNRGIATTLFETVATDRTLWERPLVALELEVTPHNTHARKFYERLGFSARNSLLRRRVSASAGASKA